MEYVMITVLQDIINMKPTHVNHVIHHVKLVMEDKVVIVKHVMLEVHLVMEYVVMDVQLTNIKMQMDNAKIVKLNVQHVVTELHVKHAKQDIMH